MALKSISLLGLIFCVGCLIALIISFASDKWVVSTETEVAGFKHMGLWSICLDQYLPPAWALVDRFYTGCWWVLDKELELLRHYLFPSWFVGTQVLVTIGLCFELLALIGQIVNSIDCFPYSHIRDKIAIGFSLGTAILHVLAGILLSIAVIMFGVRADNSRSWLERPDQNYLSWSFGMCVLAAFLAFIAALCQLFEFLRLRLQYGHEAEPSVYLTEQAPPVSRYAYSQTKVPPPPSNTGTNGQPGYVSRYNKGSQGSLAEPRPPNTLFAVSGSGDVYINRMADYDDENDYYDRGGGPRERQMGRVGGSAYNRYPNSSSGSSNPSGPQRPNGTQPRQNPSAVNGSYRKANPTEHPVLPEYVPKSKRHTGTEDEESEDDIPEKQGLESSDSDHSDNNGKKKGGTHRKDKDKKGETGKNKKSKKSSRDSDHEGGGHKNRRSSSKKSKRGDKSRDTDDDDRGSTHRSRSSSKRKSKHRSRSRDLNTSRDSYDSEASKSRGRSGSRSRHRSRSRSRDRGVESDGERSKRRRSSRRDGKSSKRDGYLTDETVGSEVSRSSKRKSRQRSSEAGRGHRDYSDGESVRGRGTSNKPAKPKMSYSSYYEY